MRIHPFPALRPPPELAARVSAPPYDVVNPDEAAAYARGNPRSFFHITRPEIDLPDEAAADSARHPPAGRAALEKFLADGMLVPDAAPSLFLYRLIREGRVQHGVVACCETGDYETVIRTHEKTRRDKEDDRTRHIVALRAHAEPVFLLHPDSLTVDKLAAQAEADAPLYDFTAPDGVRHTLWRAANTPALVRAFEAIPRCYIADGHHRAAAAVRAAAEPLDPDAPVNEAERGRFLAVLFPASQLHILPYNRAVRDLNGMAPAEFLDAVRARFPLALTARPRPDKPGRCAMYLDGRRHALTFEAAPGANPYDALDVSILQERLLAPLLGIADPRTDPRLSFIGGARGTAALEQLVDDGEAAVAFSMHPVTVDQLIALSDAGLTMPPKSTWFEPKLRSGLFLHPFWS